MKNKGKWILRGIGMAVAGAAFVVLAGFAVMGLWNWLMPTIFGLGVITWWQAMGLLVLSKILFGGHGHGRGWQRNARHGHWRKRWEEKWATMSEEERAAMKERWGGRCGHYGHHGPMHTESEKAAN